MATDKVCHSLCRRSLLHIPLLPTRFLQLFLKTHHAQSILFIFTNDLHAILRMHLYNHATVTPCRSTIARTHAIDNNLLFICSCRNDKTTRTHAKTIHPTTINLRHKGIFCSRKILSPTILIMVLYLIYQFTRMFQTHTDSYSLSLYLYLCFIKIAINITCTMSCCKDNRTAKLQLTFFLQINSLNTHHPVFSHE